MNYRSRAATNKILEMVEEGILDKDTVILACLNYMSESDVSDMAQANEFFYEDEDEEDDPLDDFNYVGSRHHY